MTSQGLIAVEDRCRCGDDASLQLLLVHAHNAVSFSHLHTIRPQAGDDVSAEGCPQLIAAVNDLYKDAWLAKAEVQSNP